MLGHEPKTALVCGHCRRNFHLDSFYSGEVKTVERSDIAKHKWNEEEWLCSMPCIYAWRRNLPRDQPAHPFQNGSSNKYKKVVDQPLNDTKGVKLDAKPDAFRGVVGASWADQVDAADVSA